MKLHLSSFLDLRPLRVSSRICLVYLRLNLYCKRGALISQFLLPFQRPNEITMLISMLLLHAFSAWAIQSAFSAGSSQILFLSGLSQLCGILFGYITRQGSASIRLSSYIVFQLIPLIVGSEVLAATLDFFVPLVSAGLPTIHYLLKTIGTDRTHRSGKPS